jgi:hypothetical protein
VIVVSLFWLLMNVLVLISLTDSNLLILNINNTVMTNGKALQKTVNTNFDTDNTTRREKLVHKETKPTLKEEEHNSQEESAIHADEEVHLNDNAEFEVSAIDFHRESQNQNPFDWPGELGAAVVLSESLIAESERRYKENEFNIVASELVALNRSLPFPFGKKEIGYIQNLSDYSNFFNYLIIQMLKDAKTSYILQSCPQRALSLSSTTKASRL